MKSPRIRPTPSRVATLKHLRDFQLNSLAQPLVRTCHRTLHTSPCYNRVSHMRLSFVRRCAVGPRVQRQIRRQEHLTVTYTPPRTMHPAHYANSASRMHCLNLSPFRPSEFPAPLSLRLSLLNTTVSQLAKAVNSVLTIAYRVRCLTTPCLPTPCAS